MRRCQPEVQDDIRVIGCHVLVEQDVILVRQVHLRGLSGVQTANPHLVTCVTDANVKVFDLLRHTDRPVLLNYEQSIANDVQGVLQLRGLELYEVRDLIFVDGADLDLRTVCIVPGHPFVFVRNDRFCNLRIRLGAQVNLVFVGQFIAKVDLLLDCAIQERSVPGVVHAIPSGDRNLVEGKHGPRLER